MRYFFRVEYDGTNYGGWQRQINAPSIQEILDKAFSLIVRQPCAVVGAGRTDAGVHAYGQGAHVDIECPIIPRKCERSVNALLPHDIGIYHLQQVNAPFHARYSALSRKYHYTITLRKKPLLFNRAWQLFYPVNWDQVMATFPHLLGCHDFGSFCSTGSSAKTGICTILNAEIIQQDYGYRFTIEADRFIYKMVRTIIGTLIDIGRGKINDNIETIMLSKNRMYAGETAPACGLVLEHVAYPPHITG